MLRNPEPVKPDDDVLVKAREALAAIIADEHFLASERTRSLLKYLAEEALNGRGDRIKAYTIAVDFLGRSEHFDPTTDPIVRVEASRLRSALHTYNERLSAVPAIRIELPKGTYVPVFHHVRDAVQNEPEPHPPPAPASPSPHTHIGHPWRTGMTIVGLVGTGITAAYLGFEFKPKVIARPVLDIRMESENGSLNLNAARVQFERAAMQQETVRLASSDQPLTRSTDTTIIRTSYALRMIVGNVSDRPAITWRLSSTLSGETMASGEEIAAEQSVDTEGLMRTIASTVAGADGIIPMAELEQSSGSDIGYPCILRAQQATAGRDTAAMVEARKCLERTIESSPRYADARASLGTLLMFLSRVSGNPLDLQEGLAQADEAFALAPTSALAAIAQAVTRYQSGQSEAAVAAARRAVALGKLNSNVLSRASAVIYFAGHWQEGLDLANEALEMAGTVKPTGASLVLMLDAYRHEDYALAIQRVDAMAKSDPVAALVKLSSLYKLGKTAEIARAYEQARKRYPDFDKVLASVADSGRYEETLIDEWRQPLVEVAKTYGSIAGDRQSATKPQDLR